MSETAQGLRITLARTFPIPMRGNELMPYHRPFAADRVPDPHEG